jgi:hypothetical protein
MQKCNGMMEEEKDRLWRVDKPFTPFSERWRSLGLNITAAGGLGAQPSRRYRQLK